MQAVMTSHIYLDEEGGAWIDDTNTKVIEVVLDKLAYEWTPEEIHLQHYGDLSMAQIYAALSYYHDHQAELDAEIERRKQEASEIAVKASDHALRQKLLNLKSQQ